MHSVRVYRKGKKNDYVCSSCSKAKALSIVKTTMPKPTKTKSKPKRRTGNPFSFLR